MKQTLKLSLVFGSLIVPATYAHAQDATPAPDTGAPAAPAAAPPAAAPAAPAAAPAKKKTPGNASLGLSPEAPQAGGRFESPAEPAPVVAQEATAEWKFDVTGYFRAPMRLSWGPATTQDMNPSLAGGKVGDAGTQIRTPPLVPDANYIDWRYTNSLVAPWTELNFHYGNDRVKATIQIASYNLTDPGYRRLESNLGINEAFITMLWPELGGSEDVHLTATVGGFTNRYGAAGRYDAGKYETYIFGRTHVAGETVNVAWDVNNDLTLQAEETFGAKLEAIPFYGPPNGSVLMNNANVDLPAWEPYPGPRAMESTLVASGHLGAVIQKDFLLGLHYIYVFANDNERSTAYEPNNPTFGPYGRSSGDPKPYIYTTGIDLKMLGGWYGDGYIGYSYLKAQNAIYLQDAIEVLHSFGGWQLHDNYFGYAGANPGANPVGTTDEVTGSIHTIAGQYSFSLAQFLWHPQAFWGQGPDLIATVFGMWNKVNAPNNPTFSISKLKFGAEVTYVPLPWLGVGGRYDAVQPNSNDSTQNFSVFSPRVLFRTDFVTHEQILVQYSRYFYGDAYAPGNLGGGSMFPWNKQQLAGAGMGVDKNAFQIAAIIWF